MDVNKIRQDFPMLQQTMQGKPLIYLDNAATTLKPQSVIESTKSYYEQFSVNTGRSDYDLAHYVDEEIIAAREIVAKLINAEAEEVVFTSGTSMSINMVAYGYGMKYLKKGDEILITQAEHASNVLPWFKVAETTGAVIKYIPLEEDGRLTVEQVEKTITNKTKVVALAQVTNVLGFVIDIKAIAKIAHKHGAILVCDGAQSVPHMPTDVKDLDVDFLAFSGHKMLGPTGIGVLYGKYDLLKQTDPFMTGGGQTAKFDLCGDVNFLAPPMKFEAGTQNISGIFGLKTAAEYLLEVGMDKIQAYEEKLKRYAISKLKKHDNIKIYNENSESGIITFNIKGVPSQDAASFFNSHGIAIRSGQHCAQVLIDFLGEVATCRASVYFYNTKEEIDKFVEIASKAEDFLDVYF